MYFSYVRVPRQFQQWRCVAGNNAVQNFLPQNSTKITIVRVGEVEVTLAENNETLPRK
jgi:hypothetical protein